MVEFLSDLVFNKILVALVLAYPVAAVLFVQRLRREDEQESAARRPAIEQPTPRQEAHADAERAAGILGGVR